MVIVYCKEQGDKKVRKAVGWLRQNGIEYQLKEINEKTFTYGTFLQFLEMTVDGLGEILTKKGDGRRAGILDGEFLDYTISDIYKLILSDPEYLDLPLMIDSSGRTATLGTRRDSREYDNLTVFRNNETIKIKD